MSRDEIKKRILENLQAAELDGGVPNIRVQPDPYGGWNIAVISEKFSGIPDAERRDICLGELDTLAIEWAEFLTPDEAEWAGPLPGDIVPEDLPLWSESLARSNLPPQVECTLPSDLDRDIEPPIVTTFYSLRGGVGRSTALAYTARILAANRRKVVCVDMDLEAPALHVLLGCETEVKDGDGVVDLLISLDQGAEPDFTKHLFPAADSDNLFVLPAGKVSADYARKLRFVNPNAWYREERNPLRSLLLGLKEKLPFTPDAILLDARTGITDLSGPLLFDLADIAVIVFFPHPQAQQGTELLTRSLLNTLSGRVPVDGRRFVPEPRFLISPVPSSKAKEVVKRYEQRPLKWINEWLQDFNQRRQEASLTEVNAEEVTEYIRYREDVATSDRAGDDPEIWRTFRPVADWIEQFIPTNAERSMPTSTKDLKSRILSELSFSVGTAESQSGLLQDFVQTENVRQALASEAPLVLGRKGTGKTALFRFLSESVDFNSVVVHSPRETAQKRTWGLSLDGFQEVDNIISKSDLEWRHFWMLYIAVALDHERRSISLRPDHLKSADFSKELGIINSLELTNQTPRGTLLLSEWLKGIDETQPAETLLLLDGLDTGFGSTAEERDRRKRSIEGLFGAWMDLGQGMTNLRFKILLRTDIWRQLDFNNKSHLFGRIVSLQWANQTAYLKVILKQAMRSSAFREHDALRGFSDTNVDDWSEERVRNAWNVLVGERMKGGQTTYTRNWVWSRLADANEDHSPRSILQLFHEAVPWERNEEKTTTYEKYVIRPRAMIRCLSVVSEEAVGALREEFPELNPLLEQLKLIGRTPVDSNMIDDKHKLSLPLAKEVGLLAVYEESGDEVVRYKVPDLYRYGLKMTRKGQA